jgi:hypothetical protein
VNSAVVSELPPLFGGQGQSWFALIELAERLGEHWLLVGGQMVFLHEIERGETSTRPTDEVVVVVDLRTDPAGLPRMHAVLTDAGFVQDPPSPDGAAHRYRRGDASFDVLAPDNLGARASLALGAGRTIAAPGATQAVARAEIVIVELDGQRGVVRRPNLVGALLGKAAAVTKIASLTADERAKHLRDFDSLARLLRPADRSVDVFEGSLTPAVSANSASPRSTFWLPSFSGHL